MTTLFPRSVTCGHCGTKNEVVGIGSTNAFGSMDLDMRPPPMDRDTLIHRIHRCEGCGYCAPDLEKWVGRDGSLESREYQAILADEGYPDLARAFVGYAFLSESSGDLGAAAWAHRNAAWVCDDQADEYLDSARKCRNAVLRLLKGLHLNGQFFTNDHVTDSILELDLLRRSGQHDEVQTRASALSNTTLPGMLSSIISFQQRLATAGDSSCYKVSDALEQNPEQVSLHDETATRKKSSK